MEKAQLTCPECGTKTEKEIPEGKSEFMYECPGCGKRIKAKENMCCVFCSYSDKRCPVSVLDEKKEGA